MSLLKRQGDSRVFNVDGGESELDAIKMVGASVEIFLLGLRQPEVPDEGNHLRLQANVEQNEKVTPKRRQANVSQPKQVEERWRAELLSFKGVGRKVADCIGLMSLDRPNAIPIDTHIQQIAARHPSFPGRLRNKATSTESVYREVQEFLTAVWGGHPSSEMVPGLADGRGMAGWVQAVMFAADLKGSTAVKLEEMVKIEERTVVDVVQRDWAQAGRRKKIKEEVETEVVLERIIIEQDAEPSVADLFTPFTPTPALSTRSDASPAESALLTPAESCPGLDAYEGEPTTPTKARGRSAGPLGKRKLAGAVGQTAGTISSSLDGLADRIKRRRAAGQ